MALHSLRASALKFDRSFILNLFIAVVAVTTLLLVCYLVFLPSYSKMMAEDRARGSTPLQTHHQPMLHEDQLQSEGKSVLDKIPDFKQSRLLRSVKKKHLKPSVKRSDPPHLPPVSRSMDVSAPPSLRAASSPPNTPPSCPEHLTSSQSSKHPTSPPKRPPPPVSRSMDVSAPPSLRAASSPLNPPASRPEHLTSSQSSKHPASPPKRPPPPVSSTAPFIPLSSIAKQQCQQEYCSEFLTSDDLHRWKECSQSARINDTQTQSQEGRCRFINQPDRDAVALVSFAGSGNTWVRGLLEAATGICTGAVYCDISLRGKGFAGEHTRGGQALVIKTHSSSSEWISGRSKTRVLREKSGLFGSAILLIRNPFDALVAEWNRKVANNFRERTTVLDSHTQAAGKEWFGRNTMWDSYVRLQMIRWQDVIKNWFLSNSQCRVLVVTYEALKNDSRAEVSRMLQFLNVGYGRLEERLNTSFHRNKHPKEFQHFTKQQRVYVNNLLKDVSFLVNTSEKSHILDVEQYIHD